jgi:hypothetical protein
VQLNVMAKGAERTIFSYPNVRKMLLPAPFSHSLIPKI